MARDLWARPLRRAMESQWPRATLRTGISRRLNLRVRFTGNATVAIRSIALRDATAQAVLGGKAPLRVRQRSRRQF